MNFYNILIMCLLVACRPLVTTTLNAELFEEQLNKTDNPQLVDVRTLAEYAVEHISGAILIDVRKENFVDQIEQLDRSRPVFVYCRRGIRSLEAATILERNKFHVVYNLEGGIIEWKDKGKRVVFGDFFN